MSVEIERKFLVTDNSYKTAAIACYDIRQGYISRNPDATVRIRIRNSEAFITVKGRTHGARRQEWEYAIPQSDAAEMLALCEGPIIDKTRRIVDYDGHRWEIDEFHGAREGLTIAEVELSDALEPLSLPPFVGREVTGDPQYYNSNL